MNYLIRLLLQQKRWCRTSTGRPEPKMSKGMRVIEENEEWLGGRWEQAKQARAAGKKLRTIPDWFFDRATDWQIMKLGERGIEIASHDFAKGWAWDLLGLFERPEPGHIRVLRFFKVPMGGMSLTKARHLCAELMDDPGNKAAYEDAVRKQPATQLSREFYRFFGLPPPKGVTDLQTSQFIAKTVRDLPEDEQREWHLYELLWDEVNEPESREDHEIKKPSPSLFRDAYKRLRSQYSVAELEDEPYLIVDALLELKPELQKRR